MTEDEHMSNADFYMSLACISAQRSKDPNTKVGACIVDRTQQIVGLGYNGMPNGVSDHELPWSRQGDRLDTKYPYVCHAELNAIINAKNSDMEGAVVYVTLFPCNECAKLIIQTGIKEVIFLLDKYPTVPDFIAAKRLFDLAKIHYSEYKPRLQSLTFAFQPDSLFKTNDDVINNDSIKNEPDYISWSEYFMAVACLSAARNRMQNYHIGVCIVNDRNRIVGIGKSLSKFACTEAINETLPQMCVYMWYGLHMHGSSQLTLITSQLTYCTALRRSVQMNIALLRQSACTAVKSIPTGNCSSLADCTIYLTRFPCSNSAKYIIHHTVIKKIIYLHDDRTMNSEMIETQKQLNFAGVECRQFQIPQKSISIKLCMTQS